MTFKEFCEDRLKEYPDGIWIRLSGSVTDECYLDENYMTEFKSILYREVTKWILDDCDYDEFLVWLK